MSTELNVDQAASTTDQDPATKGFTVVTSDAPVIEPAPNADQNVDTKTGDGNPDDSGSTKGKTDADQNAGKGKSLAKKRIADLTKKNREAEKQLAEASNAAEKNRVDAELWRRRLRTSADKDAPKRTDFESDDAYYAALDKGKMEIERKPDVAVPTEQDQEFADAQDSLLSSFEEQDTYDDFDAKVRTDKLKISSAMVIILSDLDNPVDVAYYLGSNPEESEKIAKMPVHRAATRLAKIEAQLEADKSDKKGGGKPPVKTTNAPPPIKPVQGNAINSGNPDELKGKTFKEHEAIRNEQERHSKKFW